VQQRITAQVIDAAHGTVLLVQRRGAHRQQPFIHELYRPHIGPAAGTEANRQMKVCAHEIHGVREAVVESAWVAA